MLLQPPIYEPMVGATSTDKGRAGLVPEPPVGAATKYLRGDGKWESPMDECVDDLNSTSASKPLSANQGRILKEYIDDINTSLDGVESLLSEI